MSDLSANKLFSVDGAVIVITGGGTGIGMMMTKGLVDHGAAKIYIVGRRKEKLDDAAKYSPNKIIPIVGDVTSKDSLAQVARQIKEDAGVVNLLICNSGTAPDPVGLNANEVTISEYAKRALDQDPAVWNNALSTNTTSVFFTTMSFLELLDAGNKAGNAPGRTSQVLVTSSIAGFLRIPGQMGVYPTSKAATTHLVKHLAATLAPFQIRINALAPGLFPSDLAASIIAKANPQGDDVYADEAFPTTQIPAGRLGRESDIAGTVVYYASAAAAYINGNIHVIDGGRLSQAPATY